MKTLLIEKGTNKVLACGDTVELFDIYALVNGGMTLADYGAQRAYTVVVEEIPEDISSLFEQPNYMYVDGEFVSLTESE